jgi:hypothetical protein
MPTRPGLVADATTAELQAALSLELRLDQAELRRIAERQTEALRRAGFHVTVPVQGLAAARRRRTT